MKNWEQRTVAMVVALFTLSLAACGGGGSSSGGSTGSTGGQSSTIVVSSSRLVMQEPEGMTLLAKTLTEMLVRNAIAEVFSVIIKGEEFGPNGRNFTSNAAGTVFIPVLGGWYTLCFEGEPTCREPIHVNPDTVLVFHADSEQVTRYPAENEKVVGEFAVDGQENKRIVCHKGKRSIQVGNQAVYDAHKAHGDRGGGCGNSSSVNGHDDPAPPGNNGQSKVTVCHNGRTASVPESSLSGHLSHGDTKGSCS